MRLTLGVFLAIALWAQPPNPPQPAEQVYKNIQILKGVPAARIPVVMGVFSRPVEWSDSWSDDDLREATTASLKRFEQEEREGV